MSRFQNIVSIPDFRYLLYVESPDGHWRFLEDDLAELRRYKPRLGEQTQLLRKAVK